MVSRAEYLREWRRRNPDKVKEYARRHAARLLGVDLDAAGIPDPQRERARRELAAIETRAAELRAALGITPDAGAGRFERVLNELKPSERAEALAEWQRAETEEQRAELLKRLQNRIKARRHRAKVRGNE